MKVKDTPRKVKTRRKFNNLMRKITLIPPTQKLRESDIEELSKNTLFKGSIKKKYIGDLEEYKKNPEALKKELSSAGFIFHNIEDLHNSTIRKIIPPQKKKHKSSSTIPVNYLDRAKVIALLRKGYKPAGVGNWLPQYTIDQIRNIQRQYNRGKFE